MLITATDRLQIVTGQLLFGQCFLAVACYLPITLLSVDFLLFEHGVVSIL